MPVYTAVLRGATRQPGIYNFDHRFSIQKAAAAAVAAVSFEEDETSDIAPLPFSLPRIIIPSRPSLLTSAYIESAAAGMSRQSRQT